MQIVYSMNVYSEGTLFLEKIKIETPLIIYDYITLCSFEVATNNIFPYNTNSYVEILKNEVVIFIGIVSSKRHEKTKTFVSIKPILSLFDSNSMILPCVDMREFEEKILRSKNIVYAYGSNNGIPIWIFIYEHILYDLNSDGTTTPKNEHLNFPLNITEPKIENLWPYMIKFLKEKNFVLNPEFLNPKKWNGRNPIRALFKTKTWDIDLSLKNLEYKFENSYSKNTTKMITLWFYDENSKLSKLDKWEIPTGSYIFPAGKKMEQHIIFENRKMTFDEVQKKIDEEFFKINKDSFGEISLQIFFDVSDTMYNKIEIGDKINIHYTNETYETVCTGWSLKGNLKSLFFGDYRGEITKILQIERRKK